MDAPEVVTEGNGWYEEPADRAELDVGFAATGRDRTTAVAGLGSRMAAAAPALALPAVTVRHRRLRISNEWRGHRVVGCRAAEDVGLLITDVTALERLLSALVAAEPATLAGPHWTLADPAAALRQAQERAVADARLRAEGYAAALGGRLGPLRRLSEAAEHAMPMAAMRMAAHPEAAPTCATSASSPSPSGSPRAAPPPGPSSSSPDPPASRHPGHRESTSLGPYRTFSGDR